MRRARAAASSRRLAVTACSSRARRRRAASSLRTRSWSSTRRRAASRLAAAKSSGPMAMLGEVGAAPRTRAIRRASRSVSSARSSGPAGRTVNRPCSPGSSPVMFMCVDVVSVVLDALTGGVLPSQQTASSSDPPGSVCHDSCVTRSLARSSSRARIERARWAARRHAQQAHGAQSVVPGRHRTVAVAARRRPRAYVFVSHPKQSVHTSPVRCAAWKRS